MGSEVSVGVGAGVGVSAGLAVKIGVAVEAGVGVGVAAAQLTPETARASASVNSDQIVLFTVPPTTQTIA